jgi:PAP2 superfamily
VGSSCDSVSPDRSHSSSESGTAPSCAAITESRSSSWHELLTVLCLALLYLIVRRFVSHRNGVAVTNGRTVLAAEGWLHTSPELAMNHWLLAHGWIRVAASDFYDVAALAVTVLLAIWIWFRRPCASRVVRNEMALALLIAFAVFIIFPVAPPRLESSRFVDITAHIGSVKSWYYIYSRQLDQFAALPSIHIISACWCLVVMYKMACRRSVKYILGLVGVGYVIVMALAVIATANHYLLDVLTGAMTVAISVMFIEVAVPWVKRRLTR